MTFRQVGLLLLLAGPAAASLTKPVVVAQLDARGGLVPAADAYLRQLTTSRARLAGLAIQRVRPGPEPGRAVVERWTVDDLGRRRGREVVGTIGADVPADGMLRTFLEWTLEPRRMTPTVLLLMGHGGATAAGGSKSAALSPLAAAQALQPLAARGRKLELVALDLCHGASLETVYALRDRTRYVTAAPGVVFSPGLDWTGALRAAAAPGEGDSGKILAQRLVAQGMPAGDGRPVMQVALDCGLAESMASELTSLVQELDIKTPPNSALMALVRSRTQTWGDRDELCDLGGLVWGLTRNLPPGAARGAGERLLGVLRRAVVARWSRDQEARESDPYSGLGIFFPSSVEEVPAACRQELDERTGWLGWLGEYWTHRKQLLGPFGP